MSRSDDLRWFGVHRRRLASEYNGKWLVVLDQAVLASFSSAEQAVTHAVHNHGVERASVFQALAEDPVLYFGANGPN